MAGMDFPDKIKNRKLIVVEGKDDKGFFIKLLDFLDVEDYYVWAIQGKDKFNTDLPDFKDRPGFDKITHLAIIRDQNSDDAYKSLRNILLNKMGYSENMVPDKPGRFAGNSPKIGIFIMPGERVEGTMLEDLCLKMVENRPEMRCVNEYAACMAKSAKPKVNMAKLKLLAYLAAQEEAVNSIGLAAHKGLWDYKSSCLQELRTFLCELK